MGFIGRFSSSERSDVMENNEQMKIRILAEDIGCGGPLARDLLLLAGGDAGLVREASKECNGAESMKAFILDRRISYVENELDASE